MVLNAMTNTLYVASEASDEVTIFDRPGSLPHVTAIRPMASNATTRATNTFVCDLGSFFAPGDLEAQHVFYQFDGLGGEWRPMAIHEFEASARATLTPGLHTIYAFAADGMMAGSTLGGGSPVGGVAAYHFLVRPRPGDMGIRSPR